MYDGIKDRNLSYPAVSHNCKRTILSSTYTVFVRKSIPIVAYKENVELNTNDLNCLDKSILMLLMIHTFAYLILHIETILCKSEND